MSLRRSINAAGCILLALVIAGSATGAEIYVSQDGDDGASGTSAAPLKRIQAAVDKAKDGDTVIVAGGTYPESVSFKKNDLTIVSRPGERALIKDMSGSKNAMYVSWSKNVTLRNLDFYSEFAYVVDFDHSENGLMEGCTVSGGRDIVKISPFSNHMTVRACEIHNNVSHGEEGIDLVSADYLTVEDTYIHDIQAFGSYPKGGARWCVYKRCLFERIGLDPSYGGCGVALGQAGGEANNPFPEGYQSADCGVYNCIFIDCESAALASMGSVRPKFYNNTCINVAKTDRGGFVITPEKTPSYDVEFCNNILIVGGARAVVWIYQRGLEGTLKCENNYYLDGNGKFVDDRPGGGQWNFSEWQQKLNVDKSSFYGKDPMVNRETGLLQAGSPCIDKAQRVEDVTDDYFANPRSGVSDIGAHEFGQADGVPAGLGRLGGAGTQPAKSQIVGDKSENADFLSATEKAILDELNLARTNPKGYAGYVKQFRNFHDEGNLFTIQGMGTIQTQEGLAAVDEAIKYLEEATAVGKLYPSEGLSMAADDHVRDQSVSGATGHAGSDGSSPQDRMNRHGTWLRTSGENISYGYNSARFIVVTLIIDDGVPGRGHRTNIFWPEFEIVGIATGSHTTYRTMCVMDFAGGYKEGTTD